MEANLVPVIRKPAGSNALPDNNQYENRFEVKSATSTRIYIIAQHRTGRWWGCSCPGWIRFRKCKHLVACKLPIFQKPFEARLA